MIFFFARARIFILNFCLARISFTMFLPCANHFSNGRPLSSLRCRRLVWHAIRKAEPHKTAAAEAKHLVEHNIDKAEGGWSVDNSRGGVISQMNRKTKKMHLPQTILSGIVASPVVYKRQSKTSSFLLLSCLRYRNTSNNHNKRHLSQKLKPYECKSWRSGQQQCSAWIQSWMGVGESRIPKYHKLKITNCRNTESQIWTRQKSVITFLLHYRNIACFSIKSCLPKMKIWSNIIVRWAHHALVHVTCEREHFNKFYINIIII